LKINGAMYDKLILVFIVEIIINAF
jgi:hypothetical protein